MWQWLISCIDSVPLAAQICTMQAAERRAGTVQTQLRLGLGLGPTGPQLRLHNWPANPAVAQMADAFAQHIPDGEDAAGNDIGEDLRADLYGDVDEEDIAAFADAIDAVDDLNTADAVNNSRQKVEVHRQIQQQQQQQQQQPRSVGSFGYFANKTASSSASPGTESHRAGVGTPAPATATSPSRHHAAPKLAASVSAAASTSSVCSLATGQGAVPAPLPTHQPSAADTGTGAHVLAAGTPDLFTDYTPPPPSSATAVYYNPQTKEQRPVPAASVTASSMRDNSARSAALSRDYSKLLQKPTVAQSATASAASRTVPMGDTTSTLAPAANTAPENSSKPPINAYTRTLPYWHPHRRGGT